MPEPDVHPAALDPDRLLGDCDVQRTRRSGPGGQHRNKTSSAVVLTHRPTGVSAEASERRSQHANRDVALRRLRVRLAIEIRRTPAGPSELWRSRTGGGRVSVSVRHADFPAVLAEALDALAAADWEPAPAAERLGVSTSQLIKLLKQEPAALAHVNGRRREEGLFLLK